MKEWILNIFVSLVSILLAFGVLEFAARIYGGEFDFKNFLGEERTLFSSAYPSEYDPDLGWIPKEGTTITENVWGKKVTILKNGIRSNGNEELSNSFADAAPVLVVGDSFTFGDQVSDSETWPAILERLLKKRVINGGVFGYGLDQSILRAGKLIDVYRPNTLIVGLIPDDINRCELSKRSAVEKPYFDIVDNRLIPKNVPVPRPSGKAVTDNFRHFLGYSYFVHKIMMRCCPHYWLMGITWNQFYTGYRIHNKGKAVACLLLKKLSVLAQVNDISKVYVLVQHTSDLPPDEHALMRNLFESCIDEESIRILDLWGALSEVRTQDAKTFKRYYDRHMTYDGNHFVARQLQKAMNN
ncbi:SGNH/GDSL hydrolase family protein [Thermodesulfobacteriota bacterium]